MGDLGSGLHGFDPSSVDKADYSVLGVVLWKSLQSQQEGLGDVVTQTNPWKRLCLSLGVLVLW